MKGLKIVSKQRLFSFFVASIFDFAISFSLAVKLCNKNNNGVTGVEWSWH